MAKLISEEEVKMLAFCHELEKNAALGQFLGKVLTKISPGAAKETFGKMLSWGNKTFSHGSSMGGTFKKVYNPAINNSVTPATNAIKNTLAPGQSFRPMLGVKPADITGVVANNAKANPFSYFQNPVKALGHTLKTGVGNQMRNFDYVRQHGFRDFLKQELKESQRFTRTFKNNAGENVTLELKRSVPGRVLSAAGTGSGFGALTLATNKKDPMTGANNPVPKRLFEAGKETALWSITPDPMMAKMIGYDLPKELLK